MARVRERLSVDVYAGDAPPEGSEEYQIIPDAAAQFQCTPWDVLQSFLEEHPREVLVREAQATPLGYRLHIIAPHSSSGYGKVRFTIAPRTSGTND
jgi:hypothetical protein